jgi:hypothetical protein
MAKVDRNALSQAALSARTLTFDKQKQAFHLTNIKSIIVDYFFLRIFALNVKTTPVLWFPVEHHNILSFFSHIFHGL